MEFMWAVQVMTPLSADHPHGYNVFEQVRVRNSSRGAMEQIGDALVMFQHSLEAPWIGS